MKPKLGKSLQKANNCLHNASTLYNSMKFKENLSMDEIVQTCSFVGMEYIHGIGHLFVTDYNPNPKMTEYDYSFMYNINEYDTKMAFEAVRGYISCRSLIGTPTVNHTYAVKILQHCCLILRDKLDSLIKLEVSESLK
ncbi:hypothetical protein SAMN05518847_101893 [Paenibacillus sp. OV219]|nr:hypothetical protein SAMN05518847_101893 [Paenibacillus sp. OV219]